MTDSAPPPATAAADLRKVSDARTLRALAHPVRLALIEQLSLRGPLTATQAGERIGESPTTCSFHLRQLAKYGFVEEAGGGSGRARPWRMTSIGIQIPAPEDPAAAAAGGAVRRLALQRSLDRYWAWTANEAGYPPAWRQALGSSEHVLYLTPEECTELLETLTATLLARHRERLTDPASRPADARAIELLLLSHPFDEPDQEA